MKMIRAIVRPEKVSVILDELSDAGYPAVTKIDVVGRGKQRGVKVGDVHYDQLPKEILLMVVEDDAVDEITHLICKNAKSGDDGAFGDGKIFISSVEKAFTISSGEEKTIGKGGLFMKEVMAVIRINKINETKRHLSENGFPVATCRKVYGRGAKRANYDLIEEMLDENVSASKEVMESISEAHRLIAKRLLMLVVLDDEVEKVVELITEVNQTGSMGDGKIFIMPVEESIRVRTGERGNDAV